MGATPSAVRNDVWPDAVRGQFTHTGPQVHRQPLQYEAQRKRSSPAENQLQKICKRHCAESTEEEKEEGKETEQVAIDLVASMAALVSSRDGMSLFRQAGTKVLREIMVTDKCIKDVDEEIMILHRAMWLRARSAQPFDTDPIHVAVWITLAGDFEGVGVGTHEGSVRYACRRHCGVSTEAFERGICRAIMAVARGGRELPLGVPEQ